MARPLRKRPRTSAPASEAGDLPSSSPTLQPTSSLSALGARCQTRSTSSPSSPATDVPLDDEIEAEEMKVDSNESQDSVASTSTLPDAVPLPASSMPHHALASVSLSATPTRLKQEESNDSIAMADEPPCVKAEDPISAPPSQAKPDVVDLTTSSPVKPSLPSSSAPRKRTPEEQAELKAAARRRLEATKQAKIAASATALTASLKAERDEKRKSFAAKHLGAFGFTIKSEAASSGMARFGTGKGGEAPPPPKVAPGPLGALGFEVNQAPPEPVWAPNPLCSEEQLKVLGEVRAGAKVFFTGSAAEQGGLPPPRRITRLLNYIKRPYQVCATTGIAALQVNGTTLHAWAGIGLGKESVMTLFDRISSKKDKRQNWLTTEVLISGIQIIVSGDFFQLPPVPEKHPLCPRCGNETFSRVKPEKSTLHYEEAPPGLDVPEIRKCSDSHRNGDLTKGCGLELRNYRFAFETETWAESNFQVMELTKVFRQTDREFIGMLEKFRRGICDEPCIDLLTKCGSALSSEGSIKPTNLYPLRASVDRENEAEFKKLEGRAYNYECADDSRGPRGESAMRERLKDVPGQPMVHLKLGAQVLLLTNLDPAAGLVNGSRGVIVDWIRASEARQQEAMVADPRRKSAGGSGFGSEEWRGQAAEAWVEKQRDDMLPVVFWACGVTSQGQSLDAVGVRLNGTFEKGQAYVALSRCRTPAGMKVDGFRANLVMAHETVIAFYDRIKLGLPFLASPPPTVNPLAFVPSHSPFLAKFQRIFGSVARPYPPGTPLGQAPPSNSLPANPAQIPTGPKVFELPAVFEPLIPTFSRLPTPLMSGAGWEAHLRPGDPPPFVAPPPFATWETLLQQSIDAYSVAGLTSPTAFLEHARSLMTRTFESAQARAIPPPIAKTRDSSGGPEDNVQG
ncbi:ATP-dependent DNA helicase PIF1, partial [Phenoliferia sp. Uapishka_3]